MHLRLCVLLCLTSAGLLAADSERLAEARKLHQEHHFAEARAAFESIIKAEPENPEALLGLGYAQMELGDLPASVATFEKLATLAPSVAHYQQALGDAYGLSAQKASIFSQMGLARKCIAAYDRAVALEPDNLRYRRARYEYYLSAPAIVGGGKDKALAELAEIERRDPLQGGLLRVELLLKDKHAADAFAVLHALREQRPENMVVVYQLGRVAAVTGENLDDGIAALTQYLACTPQPGEPPIWAAHWRLALALEKKGSLDDARAHYTKALRLNADCTEARDALKRLAP